MISAFCAATVGLIIASQLVAAHPATGQYFELYAIAAVVLGGTSLSGGRGTIVGTVIGAFVIGILNNGLTLMGISSFLELIITGSVIVLALIVDQLQQRCRATPRPAAAGRPGRRARSDSTDDDTARLKGGMTPEGDTVSVARRSACSRRQAARPIQEECS